MSSSDDDSDDGQFQSTVLPVATFSEYDECVPPVSGPEYLRRVQLQASRCQKIAVSSHQPPDDRCPDPPLYIPTHEKDCRFVPWPRDESLPLQTQRQLVADFSNLRIAVEERRRRISDDLMTRTRAKFPAMKEYLYWKKYCLRAQSVSDTGSDSSDDEFEDIIKSTAKATKMRAPRESKPNVKLLLSLSQNEMLQLLRFHCKWIRQEMAVSENTGRWIFWIMCCIDKPLPADAFSILRNMSRTLSVIRIHASAHQKDDSDSADTSLCACHLLICLIGRYFEQLDMIDVPSQ